MSSCTIGLPCVFLSTLSLRRATFGCWMALNRLLRFLSTLSLRRATSLGLLGWLRVLISIHALLAESDHKPNKHQNPPRRFLSTLSLRRATPAGVLYCHFIPNFYPRSPCGERPGSVRGISSGTAISIHALLAESDTRRASRQQPAGISIHALLAESDPATSRNNKHNMISIHALLAESDHRFRSRFIPRNNFYPRSPCGERHQGGTHHEKSRTISIHALLAESDQYAFKGV